MEGREERERRGGKVQGEKESRERGKENRYNWEGILDPSLAELNRLPAAGPMQRA